ncbi:MAG: HIR complex subunit [Peltula sp. TS41687]|nr:MAG: HIR complex subunit [Peltula sp. TS41687]
MRFIKPSWLAHGEERKEFEVYSCHVSPDGARLATAGGDGYVRIWSVDAIDNAGDLEYTGPRQLASLSHHSGTIHSVRFASNNKYLASGADDKIVCVYAHDPNQPANSAAFGSNEAPPTENWRVFRRLIGHDNDVQDLGWSEDSSILVSVGLDSKVVIWSGHTFEKLKTLSNHQSHVKGITFDPANKFFATASDDRTMKIFRFTPPAPNSSAQDQINNFTIEKSISAPFKASPLTTYFRRCSWSPDGCHIVASNAVNGPVSSAVIIDRGSWDHNINLIGHEGPVEVCSFSPRLYDLSELDPSKRPSRESSSTLFVTLLACAGQDRALSIWTTGQARPLLVTYDLTSKPISDLAWGPDGRSLYATSLDGSIVAITFKSRDIGRVVDLEENEKSLRGYGPSRRGAGLIEGAAGILLEEESRAGEMTRVAGRMGELMGGTMEDGRPSPHQTVNGGSGANNDTVVLQNGAEAGFSTGGPAQVNGQTSLDYHPGQQEENQQNGISNSERPKPKVTITKEGKKRVTPMLISGSSGMAETSMLNPQPLAASGQSQGARELVGPRLDLSTPFDRLPKGGMPSLVIGNKRKLAALEGQDESHTEKRIASASRNGAIPILLNGVEGLVPPTATTASDVLPDPNPEFIRPAVINPMLSVSQVRLAVPKVRGRIWYPPHSNDTPTENNASDMTIETDQIRRDGLEVRNPGPQVSEQFTDPDPVQIAVAKAGQRIWQDFLPKSVLLVTGTANFWAAACEDGSIFVWTPAGRRILNPFIVEAQPVIIESNGWWLLCVTAVGMCYLWNLRSLSTPHPPVSLAPILHIAIHAQRNDAPPLQNGPAVTSARLNSQGKMIFTLSNGDGYIYSPEMLVWQRMSEAWWAVGSQYWNLNDSSAASLQTSGRVGPEKDQEHTSAGIVPYLERQTTQEVLSRQKGYHMQRLVRSLFSREGFEAIESSISISHLENRIAAAMALGAKQDFQTNLYLYVKQLSAEGLVSKLEEVLRSLFGSVFEDTSEGGDDSTGRPGGPSRGWESQGKDLCGLDRRELLKGVIVLLGKYRDMQRVTLPYANLLGITTEPSDDHEPMETG